MSVIYVSLGFSFFTDGGVAWCSFSIIKMSISWLAEISQISPDFLRESNIVATNQCWVLGYSCYLGVASWWEYHYGIKPSDIQCMSLVVIKKILCDYANGKTTCCASKIEFFVLNPIRCFSANTPIGCAEKYFLHVLGFKNQVGLKEPNWSLKIMRALPYDAADSAMLLPWF